MTGVERTTTQSRIAALGEDVLEAPRPYTNGSVPCALPAIVVAIANYKKKLSML